MMSMSMKALMLGAGVLLMTAQTGAFASSYESRCGYSGGARISLSQAVAAISKKGMRVLKAEWEHGCYEIKAVDRKGHRVKVYVHPASGRIVRMRHRGYERYGKYERHERKYDRDRDDRY